MKDRYYIGMMMLFGSLFVSAFVYLDMHPYQEPEIQINDIQENTNISQTEITLGSATDVKNDASLGSNLVSYWELEEASGTRVDSHGSTDLTSTGVTSVTGVQGNGADFGTAGNTYWLQASVGYGDPLDITGDTTICFWMYHKDADVNSSNDDIINRYGSSGDVQYRTLMSDNGFYFFNHDGTTQRTPRFSINPSSNTWYHYCFVYDASASQVNLYLNASSIGAQTAGSSLRSSNKPLVIGRWPDGTGNNLNGYLDEIGIWDKALSGTDISNLYNSGSGIPYDAGGGSEPINYGSPKIIWFQ